MEWKPRYFEAWVKHMETNHADAFALSGGRRMKFTYPDVTTANGLTTFIIAFITWNGGNATRVNVMGRKVGNKWIKSSTRKGTADVTATIRGRSCKFEVKVGRDKPRPEQLKEQERERAAHGVYEFISTPYGFYSVYDLIVNGQI
jgi:hypothetical protein